MYVGSRKECSISTTPRQPYDYCLPTDVDYGLTITGVIDDAKETYRTILELDRPDEPDWGAEDGLHEKPVLMNVKAHISGLTAGKKYAILRYDDPKALPAKGFLNGSYAEKYEFTATASEMIYASFDQIESDGTYFFRTVLVA